MRFIHVSYDKLKMTTSKFEIIWIRGKRKKFCVNCVMDKLDLQYLYWSDA